MYGQCQSTNVSDKIAYANIVDRAQTATYTVFNSSKHLSKQMHKKQNLGKKKTKKKKQHRIKCSNFRTCSLFPIKNQKILGIKLAEWL